MTDGLTSNVFLDFDHPERFELRGSMVLLESEDTLGTTLSPQQRVRAHGKKFEAEFVVELNMTDAHERGAKLGIVINMMADFEPATVYKVQKTGLVEEWNNAHSGQDVHVGDEVVQVNNIQWHANTGTFMERIKGQFLAGRSQKDGASDMLKLYIQRPRVWKHKRFAMQREDMHKQLYATEFDAPIQCTAADEVRGRELDAIMGWKLTMAEEWKPTTIGRIEPDGALARWNTNNADKLILEGDEILKVDKVAFQHNSTTFLKNLKRHFKGVLAAETGNGLWSVALSVRRPRPVQEAFDQAHPVKEIVSWNRTSTSVVLRVNTAGGANLLGWKLSPGVEGPVLVEKVRGAGVVADWNAENPGKAILPSDQIVTLNGLTWDKYASAQEFYDAVQTALATAVHEGPAGNGIQLILERPVKSVRYYRENMEHGVHMDASLVTTTPAAEDSPDTADKQVGAKDNSADVTGATDDDKPVGAEEDSGDVIGASEDDDKAAGAAEDSGGVIGATEDDDKAAGAAEDSGGVIGATEDDDKAAGAAEDSGGVTGASEDAKAAGAAAAEDGDGPVRDMT